MNSRQWLDSLRNEFARRRLPPHYAERMIVELSDHYHDFMEEQMSKDARDSEELDRDSVDQELGSPAAIGAAAAEQYRRQRFAGRHPLFVFAVLPLVSLPILSLALMLAIGGLLYNLIPDSAPDAGAEPAWASPLIRTAICAMVILPAIGLAAWLCRAARRAALDWKWPLVACLLLALTSGSVFSNTRAKTADKPGLIILGVGTPSATTIGFQAIQLVAPPAICGWAMLRKRPQPRWG